MTVIDVVLLALVGAWTLWTTLRLRSARPIALSAFGAAIVLIAAQLAVEGFYWQFVPLYGLVALCLLVLVPWSTAISRLHWLGRLAVRLLLLLLLAVLALCWIFLPVPQLPMPGGPYAIGTTTFRWIDQARAEPATATPDDHRNVVVQAWYPAAPLPRGQTSTYIDGLGRLPQTISLVPSVVMSSYGHIDTHATLGGRIAGEGPWPVILFSPGYGAPRAAYTALVSDLASRGFVVLALDHPYEVAVTELADGTIATPAPLSFDTDGGEGYMAAQQGVRADDMAFVLAQLSSPDAMGVLGRHLDLDRVLAAGHSFGGAAAAQLLARNAPITGAINIDGTPYGELPHARLGRPYLLIQSDYAETGHSTAFLEGNAALLAGAAPGERHELTRANHYGFTDLPLFLSPPARWLASLQIGGSLGSPATIDQTNDLIEDFAARVLP